MFEGLDLITKLLAPKKIKTPASPMIEVIGEYYSCIFMIVFFFHIIIPPMLRKKAKL